MSENMFVAVDHYHKDIAIIHQFTKPAIYITTPVETHFYQFILPFSSFIVNLSTEKFNRFKVMILSLYYRYKSGFYFCFLHNIKMSKQHIFIK